MLQTQVRTLLDERSDLLVQIQDQNREITVLRRSLGFGGNEALGTVTRPSSTGSSQLSNEDLKPLLIERDSLKDKVKALESELKQFQPDSKNDIEEKSPNEETKAETSM